MTQVRFQRRQCANCGIHNTANPFEILCPKGKGTRSPHDWCIVPGWEGMAEVEIEKTYLADIQYLTEIQNSHSEAAIFERCVRRVRKHESV
jgi:hypothetical protein